MGIFLSTPSTEVMTDTGSGAGVNFAAGEMQGWRKNMEDAHIASPGVFVDSEGGNPISLFGVFDGHGGKEVSAFVKLKYIEVLTNLPSFKEGRYQDALRESFHKVDELLEDPQYDALLKRLRAEPNPSDKRKASNNAATNISVLTPKVRQPPGSIIRPLTTPDRSASPESDDGEDANSPLPQNGVDSLTIIKQLLEGAKQYSRAKSRNDSEAIAAAAASVAGNLKSLKASRSSQSPPAISSVSSAASASSEESNETRATGNTAMMGTTPSAFADDEDSIDSRISPNGHDDGDDADTESSFERDSEDSVDSEFMRTIGEVSESPATLTETETITTVIGTSSASSLSSSNSSSEDSSDADVLSSNKGQSNTPSKPSPPKSPSKANNNPFKGETYHTVFSERVNEEVVNMDEMEGTEPDSESQPLEPEVEKLSPVASSSPPSLLSNNTTDKADQELETVLSGEAESSDEDLSPPKAGNRLTIDISNPSPPTTASPVASAGGDSSVRPPAPPNFTTFSTSGNTRICQLRDHRVLAGCTAIVAMLIGKDKLVVANAGDSRGVLCRNGTAVALSEDHKPSQDREINRIKNAGGFVNMVGRVNGNLNLSRSLGDLKYKQVKHLPPEAQMITAEPDIQVIDIIPDEDEFFVLACDGIWDVLSNQEACDFVRAKVYQEHLSLDEVVHAAMKRCITKDPRASQGIGGDNMTFLVVWLKEETRPPTARVIVEEVSTLSTETASATEETDTNATISATVDAAAAESAAATYAASSSSLSTVESAQAQTPQAQEAEEETTTTTSSLDDLERENATL